MKARRHRHPRSVRRGREACAADERRPRARSLRRRAGAVFAGLKSDADAFRERARVAPPASSALAPPRRRARRLRHDSPRRRARACAARALVTAAATRAAQLARGGRLQRAARSSLTTRMPLARSRSRPVERSRRARVRRARARVACSLQWARAAPRYVRLARRSRARALAGGRAPPPPPPSPRARARRPRARFARARVDDWRAECRRPRLAARGRSARAPQIRQAAQSEQPLGRRRSIAAAAAATRQARDAAPSAESDVDSVRARRPRGGRARALCAASHLRASASASAQLRCAAELELRSREPERDARRAPSASASSTPVDPCGRARPSAIHACSSGCRLRAGRSPRRAPRATADSASACAISTSSRSAAAPAGAVRCSPDRRTLRGLAHGGDFDAKAARRDVFTVEGRDRRADARARARGRELGVGDASSTAGDARCGNLPLRRHFPPHARRRLALLLRLLCAVAWSALVARLALAAESAADGPARRRRPVPAASGQNRARSPPAPTGEVRSTARVGGESRLLRGSR